MICVSFWNDQSSSIMKNTLERGVKPNTRRLLYKSRRKIMRSDLKQKNKDVDRKKGIYSRHIKEVTWWKLVNNQNLN